jgi:hypothetical protein
MVLADDVNRVGIAPSLVHSAGNGSVRQKILPLFVSGSPD